jgi:hypothetical protein
VRRDRQLLVPVVQEIDALVEQARTEELAANRRARAIGAEHDVGVRAAVAEPHAPVHGVEAGEPMSEVDGHVGVRERGVKQSVVQRAPADRVDGAVARRAVGLEVQLTGGRAVVRHRLATLRRGQVAAIPH